MSARRLLKICCSSEKISCAIEVLCFDETLKNRENSIITYDFYDIMSGESQRDWISMEAELKD